MTATPQLPGPAPERVEAAEAPHPNHPELHPRESPEPEGKASWKDRALHHRPGMAAQLLIASSAGREECCDLMLMFYLFYLPTFIPPGAAPCARARPLLGWEEVAKQTNELFLG